MSKCLTNIININIYSYCDNKFKARYDHSSPGIHGEVPMISDPHDTKSGALKQLCNILCNQFETIEKHKTS